MSKVLGLLAVLLAIVATTTTASAQNTHTRQGFNDGDANFGRMDIGVTIY